MKSLLCAFLLCSVAALSQVSRPTISTVSVDPSGPAPCALPWIYSTASGTGWYPGKPVNGICTWTQMTAGGAFLPLDGGTLTGGLGGTAAQFSGAIVTLDEADVEGAQQTFRLNRWMTGSGWRFSAGLNTDPESGSNAGSNWCMFNYSDSSAVLGTPFCVTRATGLATFSTRPVFGTATPWDSANFNPSQYLPLTGGTLSGNLTANNITAQFSVVSNGFMTTGMLEAVGTGGTNSGISDASTLTAAGPTVLGNTSSSSETFLGNVSVGRSDIASALSVFGTVTATAPITAPSATLNSGVQVGITTGNALPACSNANDGLELVVADADNPTYLAAYKSGGTTIAPVICNAASGSWITY